MKFFRRELLDVAIALGVVALALAPIIGQHAAAAPANLAPAEGAGANGAPRQMVIIVADGVSQPFVEFASPYLNVGRDAENGTAAFDTLRTTAKIAPAPADAMNSLRGILKTATQNGYKTGLITTGNALQDAGVFYDVPAGTEAAAVAGGAVPFDFLGGGGRSSLNEGQRAGLGKANTTALMDADAFENTDQDIKGRVLSLQADQNLSYEVDRDAATETGLGDMASYAMERLGTGNAPYVLVVHDTLLAQALAAKDTPALLDEFRELDSIAGNVLSARDDAPTLGLAVLGTGSPTLPRFTLTRPTEQANSFFIVSNLGQSFTQAGQTLKGADEDALNQFSEDEYPGFAPSPANRKALLAGQMNPEAVIRAAYEPALGISYDAAPTAGTLYTIGVPGDDPVAALRMMAATKP